MSRLSFFFVTLVAAVPAALLAAVLVMGFLSHFEQISNPATMLIVSGVTLLASVAVLATPVLALLGGRDAALKAKDVVPVAAGAVGDSGEVAESGEFAEADDAEPADFGESEEVVSEDEDVFVAADDEEFGDFDEQK